METVRRYLDAGASRVILGTAAVTDPDFTAQAVAEYGAKIAVGADLKDGKVAIKGWLETSEDTWQVFFDRMQALGVQTIICTDISRDGMLCGPSAAFYADLQGRFPTVEITVSGGISSMSDIEELDRQGLRSVIVGKALYEERITLEELKRCLQNA